MTISQPAQFIKKLDEMDNSRFKKKSDLKGDEVRKKIRKKHNTRGPVKRKGRKPLTAIYKAPTDNSSCYLTETEDDTDTRKARRKEIEAVSAIDRKNLPDDLPTAQDPIHEAPVITIPEHERQQLLNVFQREDAGDHVRILSQSKANVIPKARKRRHELDLVLSSDESGDIENNLKLRKEEFMTAKTARDATLSDRDENQGTQDTNLQKTEADQRKKPGADPMQRNCVDIHELHQEQQHNEDVEPELAFPESQVQEPQGADNVSDHSTGHHSVPGFVDDELINYDEDSEQYSANEAVWLDTEDELRHENVAHRLLEEFDLAPYSTDSDSDDDGLPYMTGNALEKALINAHNRHPGTSNAVLKDIWAEVMKFEETILKYLPSGMAAKRKIRSYYRANKRLRKGLPQVYMNFILRDKNISDDPDDYIHVCKQTKYPKGQYPPKRYALINVTAFISIADAMRFIRRNHTSVPEKGAEVILSGDDVPESKSSKRSLTVIAIAAKECFRKPLPVLVTVSPRKNKYLTANALLTGIIEELNELEHRVVHFVADKPFRSHVSLQKQHNAYYACELCTIRGVYYNPNSDGADTDILEPRKQSGGRGGKMIYPPDASASMKTHDMILDIMRKIEDGERIVEDDRNLGYRGMSPLMKLREFDITKSLLPDYMHLVALGLVKKLFGLSFKTEVPGLRSYHLKTTRLNIMESINSFLEELPVPQEFNRKPRPVEYAALKAEEWRNMILFYAVEVVELIEDNSFADLWTYFFIIVRSYSMDDEQLRNIEDNLELEEIMEKFLQLWPEVLGEWHQVYNLHAFSHLKHVRRQAMLTFTSTFFSEGLYFLMKLGFRPGTLSIGKQAIARVCLHYSLDHKCQKRITFKQRKEVLSTDPNCMTYERDGSMWQIVKVFPEDPQHCLAIPVSKSPHFMRCNGRSLNVAPLGVYKLQGFVQQNETYKRFSDFEGKVVHMNGKLVTCPRHIMLESI